MNTQLIAGQAIPLTPDGNWLYLKSAQAEIEIYRESSGERVTLGKSSVFNVGEGKHLGRLLISSRTDNQIEIQFGFGTFTPPVEGSGRPARHGGDYLEGISGRFSRVVCGVIG